MAVTVDNTKGAYTIPALSGSGYVPIGGGTMTGALTLPAGAVGTPSLMFTGAGATNGFYSSGANNISVAINGVRNCYFEPNATYIAGSAGLVIQSTSALLYLGLDGALALGRDAAATLALRNGTTQQIFRLYNSYTDPSNYERLTLTGVAGTSVNITAETLGTGGDNIDIVLTPAGTGGVSIPVGLTATPSLKFVGTNAGFWYDSGAALIGIRGYNATNPDVGVGNGVFRLKSTQSFGWSSGVNPTTTGTDTGMHRNAAGVIEVNNGVAGTFRDLKLRNLIQTAYTELTEMTAPAAPATNGVRIFAQDNGAGKTQLMVQFATGAAQEIKIEA